MRWIKRLFCLHNWREGKTTSISETYKCTKCEKEFGMLRFEYWKRPKKYERVFADGISVQENGQISGQETRSDQD